MECSVENNKLTIDRETLDLIIKRVQKETARKVININDR